MSRSNSSAMLESPLVSLQELEAIGQRLETVVERLLSGDVELPAEAIPFTQLLTPITRLYAAASESAGKEFTPVTQEATATEVVMLSCALLRAQDLNPFDLALWFSRATNTASSR